MKQSRSTAKRIISGALAGWSRIGLTIVSQIIVVPIFLSRWSAVEYGAWLALLASVGLSQAMDYGNHLFLQNELLRIGSRRQRFLFKTFCSALPCALIFGIVECLVVVLLVLFSPYVSSLLNTHADERLIRQLQSAMVLNTVVYLLFGSVMGIGHRLLSVYGYYSRFAWWGFCYTLGQTLICPVIVLFGGNLAHASAGYALTRVLVGTGMYLDYFRIFPRIGFRWTQPSWRLGFSNFSKSLLLTVNQLIGQFRQQGARLVLAPLVGAAAMAGFATTRTIANFALSGLSTATGPIMPELMRFLSRRDQARSEAAFGTIWLGVIAFLAPGLVILQAVAQPIFALWTHGKFTFDPLLFAVLSMGILVFALAQPAIAVVQGNNLLRTQLWITVVSSTLGVGGMIVLVPLTNVRGAGFALLAAEIFNAVTFVWMASRWLRKAGMCWPEKPFLRVVTAVAIVAVGFGAMVVFPKWQIPVAGATCVMLLAVLRSYWMHLPHLARTRVMELVAKRLPARCRALLIKEKDAPARG